MIFLTHKCFNDLNLIIFYISKMYFIIIFEVVQNKNINYLLFNYIS